MAVRPGERLGIQSVDVAAGILAAMATAAQPLPLKELARLAGMPAAKVHRYLVSLTRSGLVAQDAGTGRYGIGPAAIALGLAGLRTTDAVRCAAEFLPLLRDETDETVVLAIWSRSGPVIIRLEESNRPIYMNIRVGSILPILRTAVGRVFAAHLPPGETKDMIERERALPESLEPIDGILAAARDRGLAVVTGALVPGVTALAAPVLDHRARIAAAVGILGRSEDLGADLDAAPAEALKRFAELISRRLGYAG